MIVGLPTGPDVPQRIANKRADFLYKLSSAVKTFKKIPVVYSLFCVGCRATYLAGRQCRPSLCWPVCPRFTVVNVVCDSL